MDYLVLLYYHFAPIADPETFAVEHDALCRSFGLRGRILVAAEGLNGTCSGLKANATEYMEMLQADPRFEGIQFKVDGADAHAFKKLFVRARPEIITLGPDHPIDPNAITGRHLSPVEWHKMMQDPNAIILDGRNDYESEIGRFEGAVCPPLENFRDFPDWIETNLGDKRDHPILTYCTGGIRCEKLSGLMLEMGFKNVYQLDGGIVTYGKDPEVQGDGFEGLCYVFDDRISTPVNRTPRAKLITHCRYCGEPSDQFPNCVHVDCNNQFCCCEACFEAQGQVCSEVCREAPEERKRRPGAKLRLN